MKKDIAASLFSTRWDVTIVDEIQLCRNTGRQAETALALRKHSSFMVGLTATPVVTKANVS